LKSDEFVYTKANSVCVICILNAIKCKKLMQEKEKKNTYTF